MAKNYSEKLRDPRWQKKRLEVLERDQWKCVGCKSKTKELHVHYIVYVKSTEPWDYPLENFKTFCDTCHTQIEGAIESARIALANMHPEAALLMATVLMIKASPTKPECQILREAHTEIATKAIVYASKYLSGSDLGEFIQEVLQ